ARPHGRRPVVGDRRRDARNGLTIPPALRLRSLVDGALHPSWWFDFLTTEPIRFAVHTEETETLQGVITRAFHPAVTMDDLSWLRDRWAGSLVVKGVMRADDAREMASRGIDGIVVSNHGGRQLDRSVTPCTCCPRSRRRSAIGSRSSWTAASGPVRTSSPRSVSGPGRS